MPPELSSRILSLLKLVFMASNNPKETWGFTGYFKITNLCHVLCKGHRQEQVAQTSESDELTTQHLSLPCLAVLI